MKRAVTITTSKELQKFQRDFQELADTVKQADGKHVLYVDNKRGIASHPSIISKADFDRVVSPAMHRAPAAFSPNVANGRFLPDKLNAAYGALAREQMKHEVLQRGAPKILNRQEYIAYYSGAFDFYPGIGAPLNKKTSQNL